MKLFYISFLLISATIILTYAYNRTELYYKWADFEIRVKGQFICDGEPFNEGQLEYWWFASWGKESRIKEQIFYPDENGFFDCKVDYMNMMYNSNNPYLYIKNYCLMAGNYRWNWYYFEDFMIRDVKKNDNQFVDFGKLELLNFTYTHSQEIPRKFGAVVSYPKTKKSQHWDNISKG